MTILVLAAVFASHGSSVSFTPRDREGKRAQLDTAHLKLPPSYRQLIDDRAVIDEFQSRNFNVGNSSPPRPFTPMPTARRASHGVRVQPATVSPEVLAYRSALSGQEQPLRGFRAPILDNASAWESMGGLRRPTNQIDLLAAELVTRRLAEDGLLFALAQLLELMGPADFVAADESSLRRLYAVGFPQDLLAPFAAGSSGNPAGASCVVVRTVAARLLAGATAADLKPELEALPFCVPPSWQGFEVAVESGSHEIGMLRMQLGGGYRHGIIPGGAIDVLQQLVTGLPQSEFLVSVPAAMIEPVKWFADHALPLTHRHQLTLVSEPLWVESWAQDNGKAGTVSPADSRAGQHATIAPRFASRDEGISTFLPTESFLMDGLREAGHQVVHFPLLFQGGNVMAVEHPSSGVRTLLLSEAVIHRNVALGLAPDQVLEIFRLGFGVDECVVLPAASYHLDFDLTVREVGEDLVAFINDPLGAAKTVLEIGIDALESRGRLDPGVAAGLRDDLDGEGRNAHEHLHGIVRAGTSGDPRRLDGLFEVFSAGTIDSAADNLRVFLLALDIVESRFRKPSDANVPSDRGEYLEAIRRLEKARLAQVTRLESLGFKIVTVPSMPDLANGINYLNGIQHREGFVMPEYGGFFARLDDAARSTFHSAMGGRLSILGVQCAELQRLYGGVHCAAAAYPRLTPPPGT